MRIWPSFTDLAAQLTWWAQQYPRRFRLSTQATSAEGRPIYSAGLTDPDTDGAGKEHVLVTNLHGGIERSGTGSVFALMEWLLGDTPAARETLRRQVVVCMPVVNPDGYVAGTHVTTRGKDPYTAWSLDGPRDPEGMPESVAVQQVMDALQPEVHADIHGLDLSFPGYMTLESSAASYSNLALRPYHRGFQLAMDAAALEGGFPSDRLEEDAEQLLWGPQLDAISPKLWRGRPRPYAAVYCYNRYHTMVLASEAMWETSGLLRHRRLLELGNTIWPGEYYPGYPTRVAMWNILHKVVAYGPSAAARRRSRVELWTKRQQLSLGLVNPQKEGLAVCVCATSPDAAEPLRNATLSTFLERLSQRMGSRAEHIRRLFDDYPTGAGQWGSEPSLFLEASKEAPGPCGPIENGLGLQLRIPYPRAHALEVLMNGAPVERSEHDGYITWNARGYVYLQINIAPERARQDDLFVVTCRYDPGEKRPQGWQPTFPR